MTVISLIDISKLQGDRYFLKNIAVSFEHGDKVCILGPNGSGKSTILRIISGEDKAFDGDRILKKGITIGYLEQEPLLNNSKNIIENIKDGLGHIFDLIKEYDELSQKMSEVEGDEFDAILERFSHLQEKIDECNGWDIERNIQIAMDALGCPAGDRMPNNLSGGEQRRVVLCRLLLQNNDVLLLDEPTNHLDNFSVQWLTDFLKRYKGTVIFVSHARQFADEIANNVLEIENGSVIGYKGNYSDYLEQKAIKEKQQAVRNEKLMKRIESEKEWVSQSPRARLTKNKARIEAFNRMVESVDDRKPTEMELPIPKPPRMGNVAIKIRNLTKKIGDRTLINNFSCDIVPGSIVGVIGQNGVGKSTLAKILAGFDSDYEGEIIVGPTVVMNYVSQLKDDLDQGKTIWEEISNGLDILDLGNQKLSSRLYCSLFNFKGTDQQKKIDKLSGGEKNRVYMAKALTKSANFLILDEPTNDLDLETIQALEESLTNFAGNAFIISHDEWFLNKICTHIIYFLGDGRVYFSEGNCDYLLNSILEDEIRKFKTQRFIKLPA